FLLTCWSRTLIATSRSSAGDAARGSVCRTFVNGQDDALTRSAGILRSRHRIVDLRADGAEPDAEGLARRLEADLQVRVVAERLALRSPATAERGPRQHLLGPVLELDADLADHP